MAAAAQPEVAAFGPMPPENHHPVSTKNPAAQAAFDDGLLYRYGFNAWDAERAFRKAAALDPGLAMAHWGIALALGPDINTDATPERAREAARELQTAKALAAHATPGERALIDALALRDPPSGPRETEAASLRYAQVMAGVARRYPGDPDAATLYAESLMNLQPDATFFKHGQAIGRTPAALAVLRQALARFPRHLGANHLFIHLVAQSDRPADGLPSAVVLSSLTYPPGGSHLAHMAVHVFYRVGRYADAIRASDEALRLDAREAAEAHAPQRYSSLTYHFHNIAYRFAAELMGGTFEDAMANAAKLDDEEKLHALVRFARWGDILKVSQPSDGLASEAGREWLFARTAAFLRLGRNAEARAAATRFFTAFAGLDGDTSSNAVSRIEAAVVRGLQAEASGQRAQGISHLQAAVAIQDDLTVGDVPEFFFPVREWLGAALAEAGRKAEARAVFTEDLRRNAGNPRSLKALAAL